MDVEIGPSSVAEGRSQANLAGAYPGTPAFASPPSMRKMRKRKAESQENERLSKRLSLLNLEHNGQKLYVPVERPQLQAQPPAVKQQQEHGHGHGHGHEQEPKQKQKRKHEQKPNGNSRPGDEDVMQLDDSKHKVYIYDLDAELSDSGESDDGRLVFLPDIEKHLRETRIPPSIRANKEGELAGMQLVLYSEPTSLTVPEEHDSVRKAIVEARARLRQKQKEAREGTTKQQHDESSSKINATSNNTAASRTIMLNGSWPQMTVDDPEPEPEPMDID